MDHLDEGSYKKKGKNQHVLRWRDKMRETQRSISTQRLGLVGKRFFDTLQLLVGAHQNTPTSKIIKMIALQTSC